MLGGGLLTAAISRWKPNPSFQKHNNLWLNPFEYRCNSVADFARQIARLLERPEMRARMGQRARALVETRLSWDCEKQNLLYAYAQLFPELLATHTPLPVLLELVNE